MKFSKSWVDEWIQASLASHELAEQITMAGWKLTVWMP